MKIAICGDVHWSKYSSICRSRGNKYSNRLHNLIDTINWVESVAQDNGCEKIVYLGDFFDKSLLESEEISALSDIDWKIKDRLYLVGNHELGTHNAEFNTSSLFDSLPDSKSIDTIMTEEIDGIEFIYLPYILESDRLPLSDVIPERTNKKRIIFSHNDIAGIQLGGFVSTSGYPIEEIENCCDLFINGHLHNGSYITDKILNVGNITGQNFSEDASSYSHHMIILDTSISDHNMIKFYENPYALNFYKFNCTEKSLDFIERLLSQLKDNSVISLTTSYPSNEVNDLIASINKRFPHRIVEKKIITNVCAKELVNPYVELSKVDHIAKFNEFILNQLGDSDVVKYELSMIN